MEKKSNTKIRIGDLLVEKSLLSDKQLKYALEEQRRTGRKIGRVVVDLGFITEDKLLMELAKHFSIPFVNLLRFQFDENVTRKLPETQARRFRSIILTEEDKSFLVGMVDPMDLLALDELKRVLGKQVFPAFVKEGELLSSLDRVYRRQDEIASIAGELEGELQENDFNLSELLAGTESSEAPVVRLLKSIFEDAIQIGASDIHIEPDETVLRVRQRVDGELQEQVMKEKRVVSALVSRLKIMSGLDISEKRLPQDGRFNVRIKDRSVDVRLSTMPTQYGESVVMRLLDQSKGILTVEKLGMPKEIRERFLTIIERPYGMVLVTGPTGSGKTTTLYAALSRLNISTRKIITAEDPIEYRLPRIVQVQINNKIELNFARVLKTALRQDPDIILVGEIRDIETAEIALRAAMTGHLVLSTLHTNDAISTAMRLIDMGIDPFLVASSLSAVIGQRLIRKICPHCIVPYALDPQEKIWLHAIHAPSLNKEFKYGKGCHNCHNTGYIGRVGVYELLELDETMLEALRKHSASEFVKAARASPFYMPLVICALKYAIAGITSIKEVFKLSANLEDRDSTLLDTAQSIEEPKRDV
jgi:MSHA biogenesis protein MshE